MAKQTGFDFTLRGDPAHARAAVVSALESRGFGLDWHDEWTATAERGSKTANLLAGAFAQHFKMGIAIRSAGDDTSILRVEQQSSGAAGGLIGLARTKKNTSQLRQELETTFSDAGVLVGVAPI